MALLISICKVKFTDETKDNCSLVISMSNTYFPADYKFNPLTDI